MLGAIFPEKIFTGQEATAQQLTEVIEAVLLPALTARRETYP
jgi:hypothetical protein